MKSCTETLYKNTMNNRKRIALSTSVNMTGKKHTCNKIAVYQMRQTAGEFSIREKLWEEAETGGSSLGGAAHVLDYVGCRTLRNRF